MFPTKKVVVTVLCDSVANRGSRMDCRLDNKINNLRITDLRQNYGHITVVMRCADEDFRILDCGYNTEQHRLWTEDLEL